jgi:small subunit ribosomal protein S17
MFARLLAVPRWNVSAKPISLSQKVDSSFVFCPSPRTCMRIPLTINALHPFHNRVQLCRYFSVEAEYKTEISDILAGYEEKKKRRQAMIGTVVSVKCSKSIVVRVPRDKFNSKYNKTIQVHKRIMAHDQDETGQLGDLVRIVPCRPVSRKKRHSLIDIIRRPMSATLEKEAAVTVTV